MANLKKAEPQNSQGITTEQLSEDLLAKIAQSGDLSYLSERDRLIYYFAYARQLGLNPLSRPFDYIEESKKDGSKKISLYPNSIAASQLRDARNVSTRIVKEEILLDGEIYSVLVEAKMGNRIEQASGKVAIATDNWGKPMSGDAKAKAMKKAETQARRRATLAIVGLDAMGDEDRRANVSDMPMDVWDSELSGTLQAIASSPVEVLPPEPPKQKSVKQLFAESLVDLGIDIKARKDEIIYSLGTLNYRDSSQIPEDKIYEVGARVATMVKFLHGLSDRGVDWYLQTGAIAAALADKGYQSVSHIPADEVENAIADVAQVLEF